MLNTLIFGCLLGIVSSQNNNDLENLAVDEPTPIVIWHGMGDNCCHSFSMGRIKEMLEQNIEGKNQRLRLLCSLIYFQIILHGPHINYIIFLKVYTSEVSW